MHKWSRGAGNHVLYFDGSSKWLEVCIVSAEMLNCKLLSPQAEGIENFYFTWCDGNLIALHINLLPKSTINTVIHNTIFIFLIISKQKILCYAVLGGCFTFCSPLLLTSRSPAHETKMEMQYVIRHSPLNPLLLSATFYLLPIFRRHLLYVQYIYFTVSNFDDVFPCYSVVTFTH